MIKLIDLLNEDKPLTVYRGAKSPEFNKGDFEGVWVSPDKKTAGQYVAYDDKFIFSYILSPDTKLLNTNDEKSRKLEQEFIEKYPDEEEFVNQEGDFAELWMFPPKEFIKLLKYYGWDGYINGTDYFIVNTEKLKS